MEWTSGWKEGTLLLLLQLQSVFLLLRRREVRIFDWHSFGLSRQLWKRRRLLLLLLRRRNAVAAADYAAAAAVVVGFAVEVVDAGSCCCFCRVWKIGVKTGISVYVTILTD